MADTGAMSDTDTTPADSHDDGHGHAPAGEPLGPINLVAWGYAIAGAVLGALVVLALFIARG
jgi:hypothetical protein